MRITNKYALPELLRVAAIALNRKPRDKRSVTELLTPAWQRQLYREHWDSLEVDVSDMAYQLLGTGLHGLLSEAGLTEPNTLTDEVLDEIASYGIDMSAWEIEVRRERALPDGRVLTGQADFFDGTVLWDFKTTTVWKVVHGVPDDWAEQLRSYDWLAKGSASDLGVCAILRDWSKLEAKRRGPDDYPQRQVVTMPVLKRDLDEVEARIVARYDAHVTPQREICTPEDRWNKGNTYAVMKKGRKTALRVLDSMEEADAWIGENGKPGEELTITLRPGLDTRCISYCIVAPFCTHGQKVV